MKTLALVLIVLTTSAFASSTNLTWEQINNHRTFKASFYQIPADLGLWQAFIPVNKFCLADGETLRSKNMREFCSKIGWERNGRDQQKVCLESFMDYIYAPVNYENKYCSRRQNRSGDCTAWRTVQAKRPLTFKVDIYSDRRNQRVIMQKEYTVPFCN